MAIIQIKRGTALEWSTANPILALAELGLETDTSKMKAGDGTSSWSQLPYVTSDELAANVTSINGQTGDIIVTKVDVGLDKVDNTSDADKPISTATQAALDTLDGKVVANEGNIADIQGILSGLGSDALEEGLGNVINGLDGRITTNEENIDGLSERVITIESGLSTLEPADVGLGNVDNTSDLQKVIEAGPIQDAFGAKADYGDVELLGVRFRDGKILPQQGADQFPTPPVNANDAGVSGTVTYDADYLYVCVANNTWKRAQLTTW